MSIFSAQAIGIGLILGSLLGLTGAGGSLVALPLLLSLHLPMRDAIGVSLGAVGLAALIGTIGRWPVITLVTGSGFAAYLSSASPPLGLLFGLFVGGSVGVLLGNKLAYRLGGPTLQRIFAMILLAVSLSVAAQKLLG